jgi:hypothetical protein
MRLARLCFKWQVLLALAVVGVGIWIAAPSLLLKALPLLLLAACPLSMLVMAWGMKRGMEGTRHDLPVPHEGSPKPAQVDPRERLADLETRQAGLQIEIGPGEK